MLVQLMPEDSAEWWDELAPAIEQALVPFVTQEHFTMEYILESVIADKLILWMITADDEKKTIKALVATSFIYDDIAEQRNLLIYAAYAYEPVSVEEWQAAHRKMSIFAKNQLCKSIIAYTEENPRVIQLAKSMGAETKNFLKIPIL